ncbi:MAG: ADP-ribosylation factor-directed GTPase activating protein isoform b [Pirellulales bacterium]|nr:ADP-ribosylation factor-directed GTPase activating protein isoform b [Pirellulales bacterium]
MSARRPIGAGCLFVVASLLVGCSSSEPGDTAQSQPAAPAAIDDALKNRLDDAINFTQKRHMEAGVNNAWQIVHGILAYGRDLKIKAGGNVVPALDYLLEGGQLRGWTLRPASHGVEAIVESGTKAGQGHKDQWIGYMSLIGLPPDQKLIVQEREFTLMDMLTQAQWEVQDGMEASWTIMALSSYLSPLDAKWTASNGKEWQLEQLVAMEAAQDLAESPCGGTHRLYGLAMALNNYLADRAKRGETGPLTGGWLAADKKIKDSIALAKKHQQNDGTFSTQFFIRPATSTDISLQLHATGHTFEFLTMALPDEVLREPWMVRAADALCRLFDETRSMELECGALYHAAHGLILYRERLFGPLPPFEGSPDQAPAAIQASRGVPQ